MFQMAKMCVLDEFKECTGCGECEMCDLDPNKKCDNCMKCVNSEGAEFRGIEIDEIVLPEDNSENEEMLNYLKKEAAEQDDE